MKKYLIGILTILCSPAAFAQYDKTFEFMDKDMNVIPDGTVINVNTPKYDDHLGWMLDSGLFVKDNTGGAEVAASCEVDITQMSNGSVQICFPLNCYPLLAVGKYETDKAKPSEWLNGNALSSEWFPEEYGTCTVTYRLKAYDQGGLKGYGPSVTINYIYSDPTGIDGTLAEKKIRSINYFDLSGREVSAPVKGVYVKRTSYADGKVVTEKTLVK